VTARLGGDEQNDWDLALFDAASGRRLDASEAPGANEVVQALVRRGQTLLIQACRLDGSAARERLTISPVATPLAQSVPKPAQQSLVSIPIGGPRDIPALEALGLNLDEAGSGRQATASPGALNAATDASGSKDSDGTIADYAWDLDGDGSMETDSGTSPTLRHAFGAGLHHLTVRVTDNQGERSYANATVKVAKRGAAAHKKKHKHKKKHHHKRHKKHKKKT
jgi:hypothetical protein